MLKKMLSGSRNQVLFLSWFRDLRSPPNGESSHHFKVPSRPNHGLRRRLRHRKPGRLSLLFGTAVWAASKFLALNRLLAPFTNQSRHCSFKRSKHEAHRGCSSDRPVRYQRQRQLTMRS